MTKLSFLTADRFVVQCHIDEVDPDAVPNWYILYRRSAAKLTSVDLTDDVVHRARFVQRTITYIVQLTSCLAGLNSPSLLMFKQH